MKISCGAVLLGLVLMVAPVFANLWYLRRGADSLDDAWAVTVDSSGRVYWATTEWQPRATHNDIFLYIVDSTGRQLWRSQPLSDTSRNRVAFIAVLEEPNLYIGGRIEKISTDLLLLSLRRDQDTFVPEWQYIWDQARGYEEVDGIGVEGDVIYLSGWTTPSLWNNDIVVQKLNRSGTLLWSSTWGGPGLEGANGHLALDANNIYLASHLGTLDSSGNAILIAFSKDSGTYLWDSIWDGYHLDDNFFGLEMSSDSFLYCFGYTDTEPSIFGQLDLILVKYTRTGQKLWERRWGGPNSEWGRAILADGDSVVYICGNTASYGGGATDIVLVKYNSSGELLGCRTWGGRQDDIVHDIVKFGDHLYITGRTQNFGAEQEDALLIKANARTMELPDTLIGIEDRSGNQPVRLTVTPNPFINQTAINFSTRNEPVWLTIYDPVGQVVRDIFIPARSGTRPVIWNGRDNSGKPLDPGIYFIQLKAGTANSTGKVLLLRH
ncbi:T9SS type A sorting domain-containing protein [candidate division WOR-3 bacterium]|nr:T9SS type A sorting domain-containing protein [candidate division WOR-3 bacterium]